jgi:pimeloyl-ACP methyl ester carboxylesterase
MSHSKSLQTSTVVRAKNGELARQRERALLQLLNRHFPKLGVRVLTGLFFNPGRRQPALDLCTARRCFQVNISAGPVAVGVWGKGPLVLLVQGWAGSGEQLRVLRDGLVAAGLMVACFDGPAHGASQGHTTHLGEFVDVILAVAEQLGPLHAVVGHSLGGTAAVLAAAQGLELPGLVCIAPMPSLEFAVSGFLDAVGVSQSVAAELTERVLTRAKMRSSQMRLAALQPNARHALLVHDMDDRAIPVSESVQLASRWQGAQLMQTHGRGHLRVLSDPRVVARIGAFLTRLPQPSATLLERQLANLAEVSF